MRGSYQTASASTDGALAAELDGRVVLAGDHVRVRHHEAVARRPSRCPARRGRRPSRARARRCRPPPGPPGRARSSRWAGGTFADGPRIEGNGSKRASAWRIGPDGGSAAFSSLQDRRALDRLAQLARAGRLERHGPAIQTRNRPEARDEHAAAHPVEQPEALAEPLAQVEAEHLEARGEDARRAPSAPISANSGA